MRQLLLDIDFEPRLTKGDFFVSSSNVDAYDMVFTPSSWVNGRLVLRGPAKSGKSHLARIWAEEMSALVISTRDEFQKHVLSGAAPLSECLNHAIVFEDCDALFAAMDSEDQVKIFHLLNAAQQSATLLMFTADAPIANWSIITPDVRSRLEASGQVTMKLPDDALIQAMLVKLFDDKGIRISENAINYLVLRVARDFESIYQVVASIDRLSREMSSNVTRAFISKYWENISNQNASSKKSE